MSDYEEEVEQNLKALKKQRGTAKAAITRLLKNLETLMDEEKATEVTDKLQELESATEQLQKAHDAYHKRLTDDDDVDIDESDTYLTSVLGNIQNLRHTALSWLNENKENELKTHDASSQPYDTEVTKEALRLEVEELRAIRELERERFELNMRREEEQFQLELQRQRYKTELQTVIPREQPRATDVYSTPLSQRFPSNTRPSLSPISEDSISQLLELSRQQYQAQVDSLRLPPTDLIKFDGDPLQYWKFMRLFTTMVDQEFIAAEEKLTRLHQYTEGKARDAISHCLYNPSPLAGFKEAMECLQTRFGNPHTISQAWIDKVLNFATIKGNIQLRDFADHLRGCRDTLKAMGCEDELNGRQTLLEIIQRLPGDLKPKWLNENYRITQAGRLPKLDDVVKFVETEAEKRDDPVFGGILNHNNGKLNTLCRKDNSANKKSSKPTSHQSFSTNAKASTEKITNQPTKQMAGTKCLKCSELHFLNQCSAFHALTVPQ